MTMNEKFEKKKKKKTPDYAIDFLCHDQKIIFLLFAQAIMLEHIRELICKVVMLIESDFKKQIWDICH